MFSLLHLTTIVIVIILTRAGNLEYFSEPFTVYGHGYQELIISKDLEYSNVTYNIECLQHDNMIIIVDSSCGIVGNIVNGSIHNMIKCSEYKVEYADSKDFKLRFLSTGNIACVGSIDAIIYRSYANEVAIVISVSLVSSLLIFGLILLIFKYKHKCTGTPVLN